MDLATITLVFAAIGGVIMLTIRLSGRPRPPMWLAIAHGSLALFGVGLLAGWYAAYGLPPLARVALGVFLLAAIGGATLFAGFHLRGRPLPVALVLGHGLFALTGLTLLILALVRSTGPGVLPFGRPPPALSEPEGPTPMPIPPTQS
jgi:hypothetical protein